MSTASLGQALREHRSRAGLTQQELARHAGIGVRTLRDLEQGRVRRPQPRSIQRLAGALGLSAASTDELVATLGRRPGADSAGDLEIQLLGPLSVTYRQSSVELRSSMQRLLLGILALHPAEVVLVADVVDLLWGDRPPRTCLGLVHGYIAGLRSILEPERPARAPSTVIAAVRGGYRLALTRGIDVHRFEDLARRAERARWEGDTGVAFGLFGEALDCWRGHLLAGDSIGFRLRRHPKAAALARRRLDVTLAAADLALRLGRSQQAASWLRELAYQEPLHEPLHARLMIALAGCGQQADALHLYTEIRDRLAEDLGVEPGKELHDAYLRVLRRQVPTGVQAKPSSLPAPPQLPAKFAGFTGHAAELCQLDVLLARDAPPPTTVVTATVGGFAGIGKTTFAVHWAHRVRNRFPDGQLYLDLRGFDPAAPAMSPAEALQALLELLKVPFEQIPTSSAARAGRYRSMLAGKRVLVLLDNALDSDQVRPLLPSSPGSMVLVTSRDPLAGLITTEGAQPVRLEVLTEAESRQLLALRLGTERTSSEPDAVDAIVTACGGLPLALAIVAARAATNRTFPLSTFATELTKPRRVLDALTGPDPTSNLRAAFAASYRRLSPPAARLFRFLGGCSGLDISLGAAARYAGGRAQHVHELLTELVRAGLLTEPAPARYSIHELLRAYATDLARVDAATEPCGHLPAGRSSRVLRLHPAVRDRNRDQTAP